MWTEHLASIQRFTNRLTYSNHKVTYYEKNFNFIPVTEHMGISSFTKITKMLSG